MRRCGQRGQEAGLVLVRERSCTESQAPRGVAGRESPVSGGWAASVADIFFMARKAKIKDVTAVIVPGDGSTLNTLCVCFGCSWGSCI